MTWSSLQKTGILSTQQCTLIPGSGVDTKRFIYLPFPAQQQPMVVFVGRLLWSKGIGEIVEAAQALRKAGCTARFIAAGDRMMATPTA
jgi:glycosyltransferase involved in cell wall biosynthesis